MTVTGRPPRTDRPCECRVRACCAKRVSQGLLASAHDLSDGAGGGRGRVLQSLGAWGAELALPDWRLAAWIGSVRRKAVPRVRRECVAGRLPQWQRCWPQCCGSWKNPASRRFRQPLGQVRRCRLRQRWPAPALLASS